MAHTHPTNYPFGGRECPYCLVDDADIIQEANKLSIEEREKIVGKILEILKLLPKNEVLEIMYLVNTALVSRWRRDERIMKFDMA